jgi:thiamine biosynthesis lipoprotein
MDPGRGAPLPAPPASVTVVAPTCAEADAWATALMVAGPENGVALAERHELNAMFLLRDDAGGVRPQPVGRLFSGETAAVNDMPSSVGVIKTGGFVAAPQPGRRF